MVSFTAVNLINFLFIAMGIGVCALCFRQVSVASFLENQVRAYFQIFFLVVLAYITTHLAREVMNGLPGDGVRTALQTLTFIEMIMAGTMSQMISLLVVEIAQLKKSTKTLVLFLYALLIFHVGVLIFNLFKGNIYYFDESNVYHRGGAYFLSNIGPLAMIILDIVLLVRHGKKMPDRARKSLWIYTVAPLVAALIQTFSYGIQYIILASISAAVYLYNAIMQEQTEAYEKQQVEASRLDTELSMATRIQADMLPNIFPAFPEREDFDVYATMTPAKEVGGDFYDFFLIDPDHLGIVMADVSGKGVPAALFMMISKILIQNFALTGRSPKEVLESVNDQICLNNKEEMFVTVWVGKLNLKTGHLVAANAGHEYPAIKGPTGSFELVHDKHGLVVGAMSGMKYTEYELDMKPGSKLFLYTDGVPEATNAQEELFGTDRMVEALRAAENGTPQDILDSVHQHVDGFVKDAPQFDDLTMLLLQYNG